jgi:hypothetical protein
VIDTSCSHPAILRIACGEVALFGVLKITACCSFRGYLASAYQKALQKSFIKKRNIMK